MLKILIGLLFLFNCAYAATPSNRLTCDPKLKTCFTTMQKLSEVRKLIEDILKEGPLTIGIKNTSLSDEFGAYWDMDNRIIFVSNVHNKSEGALINTILFEMQNALVNSQYEKLDYLASKKKIDRKSYVKAYEHLEYLNSVNAAKIADSGIRQGIFPKNAKVNTYKNFEEHYYYQQISGHSDFFAQNYDRIIYRN